ncbi:hypothetical protein JL720_15911 [Aureococcus anophagefferens]|nr:hypothetical protein JL720_15911 [Aureococcus anophagefferens]
MGRTLEGWMRVYNCGRDEDSDVVDKGPCELPYFKLSASTADSAQVAMITEGNFAFGFVEDGDESTLVPMIVDPDVVYHTFSRIHGDLERDYNNYQIDTTYYSQGSGNYRDVNQNRRSTPTSSRLGDFNLREFLTLKQADGYNPLTVATAFFSRRRRRRRRDDAATPRRPPPLGVCADDKLRANYTHEGFWADHWDYDLDQVISFEAIFPDDVERAMWDGEPLPFYMSVYDDPAKLGQLNDRITKPDGAFELARDSSGETDDAHTHAYAVSPVAKLFLLCVTKFALLDPSGMGIEMDANKPGWNDAMNGLPGLLGSGMADGGPFVHAKAFKAKVFPLFLEGPVRQLKTVDRDDEAQLKAIHDAVLASDLYDEPIGQYKICESLEGQPFEMGRMMAFTPGWLENESIWLHMSFKWYLELIRAKLFDEFWTAMETGAPYNMDVDTYGRSPLECGSFIVSSAYPDESMWGTSFLARLSGSTAEFLSMWLEIFVGSRPFSLSEDGELELAFAPALKGDMPAWDCDVTKLVLFADADDAEGTTVHGSKLTGKDAGDVRVKYGAIEVHLDSGAGDAPRAARRRETARRTERANGRAREKKNGRLPNRDQTKAPRYREAAGRAAREGCPALSSRTSPPRPPSVSRVSGPRSLSKNRAESRRPPAAFRRPGSRRRARDPRRPRDLMDVPEDDRSSSGPEEERESLACDSDYEYDDGDDEVEDVGKSGWLEDHHKTKRWEKKEAELRAAMASSGEGAEKLKLELRDKTAGGLGCVVGGAGVPTHAFSGAASFKVLAADLLALQHAAESRNLADGGDRPRASTSRPRPPTNVYHWRVLLSRFPPGSPMAAELGKLERAHGYGHVELEVRFTIDLYPFFPPPALVAARGGGAASPCSRSSS